VVQQGGHVAVATGLDGCPPLTDDPTRWRWLPLIVPHKSGTLGAMVVALSVTTATTTGQCHDHQKELGGGRGWDSCPLQVAKDVVQSEAASAPNVISSTDKYF
jgi:hypothetical protein